MSNLHRKLSMSWLDMIAMQSDASPEFRKIVEENHRNACKDFMAVHGGGEFIRHMQSDWMSMNTEKTQP